MIYLSVTYPILLTSFWYHKAIRHTTFTVELGSKIKLPCLQWGLVTSCDDTLKLILQRFVTQLILAHFAIERSLLHIRIAESYGHGPSAQNLHIGFHLPVVREILRTLYIVHVV